MAFQACHRFARISPRKVRPLADMIRGKFADEALAILRYQPQRGARMLEKVINSALGSAQDPDQTRGKTVDVDNLVVTDARIDGGPDVQAGPASGPRHGVHDQETNVPHSHHAGRYRRDLTYGPKS